MAQALRYIDLEHFIEELPTQLQGLLTDDKANSQNADTEILRQKALAAESEVESYLSSRYDLPLKASDGTVPGDVVQSVYDILKYKLYARRNALTDSIITQYKNRINWLRMVSKGDLDIPVMDEDNVIENSGGTSISVSSATDSEFSIFL